MKFSHCTICLVVLTLALPGCTFGAAPVRKFDPIDVNLNKEPKSNFLIMATFENVDAAEFSTTANALYRVTNRDCVAVDPKVAIGGLQLLPEYQQPLRVNVTKDGKRSIAVSLDALRPDDYFGLGACNWALDGLTFRFSNGRTQFVTGLSKEQIEALKPSVSHFLVSDLTTKQGQTPVFGEGKNYYLAKLGPQFTANLQPTAATQTLGEAK